MRKLLLPIAAAVALLAAGGSKAVTPSCPADDDGTCIATYYYNTGSVLSFGSDAGVLQTDGLTRCWSRKYPLTSYTQGTSYEHRTVHAPIKWCARNSKITSLTGANTVTSTYGSQCNGHDERGFVDGGGIGTAAIYLHVEAKFDCFLGAPFKLGIPVHDVVWMDLRMGVQGGLSAPSYG